jgi:hypothetical protein
MLLDRNASCGQSSQKESWWAENRGEGGRRLKDDFWILG